MAATVVLLLAALATKETAAMFALVDGRTTIAQIVAARTSTPELYAENRQTAYRLFSWMHDHDHLMYRI